MLLFNVLPIIPLDGSKIINLIFSKYLNLNFSNNLTVLISFITLSMILIGGIYEKNYSMVMVVFILLQNIWNYYKKIEYIYNKFVLERYLYNETYYLLLGVVEEKSKDMSVREKDKSFIADFYKYGFVGIMLDWIDKGMQEDYHKIVQMMGTALDGNIARSIENFKNVV